MAAERTSEGGRQGRLPATHLSYGAGQRGMQLFSTCFRKGLGVRRVPHTYKGLTRCCRFPIPCSCLLPPQETNTFFLGPSLASVGAGQAPQYLCLQSLKEDMTQPQLHQLAACSSLPPTSPWHLLPLLREGDSFTTPMPQQELQGL